MWSLFRRQKSQQCKTLFFQRLPVRAHLGSVLKRSSLIERSPWPCEKQTCVCYRSFLFIGKSLCFCSMSENASLFHLSYPVLSSILLRTYSENIPLKEVRMAMEILCGTALILLVPNLITVLLQAFKLLFCMRLVWTGCTKIGHYLQAAGKESALEYVLQADAYFENGKGRFTSFAKDSYARHWPEYKYAKIKLKNFASRFRRNLSKKNAPTEAYRNTKSFCDELHKETYIKFRSGHFQLCCHRRLQAALWRMDIPGGSSCSILCIILDIDF